jgi:hypothetical protein
MDAAENKESSNKEIWALFLTVMSPVLAAMAFFRRLEARNGT